MYNHSRKHMLFEMSYYIYKCNDRIPILYHAHFDMYTLYNHKPSFQYHDYHFYVHHK